MKLTDALKAPTPQGQMPHGAWWPLMLLVALSPLWSKWGGAAWLWLALLGGWAAWRWPVTLPDDDPRVVAARWWAWACVAALAIRAIPQLHWGDPWGERHVDFRLMFGAMATYALVRRVHLRPVQWQGLLVALVLMGLAAFYTTYTHGRDTTSNPIPWAAAMTFGACVLLGLSLYRPQPTRFVWLIGLGLLAFCVGVALSESRGAYGLFVWLPGVLLVAAVVWWRRQIKSAQRLRSFGVGVAVLLGALVLLWSQPRLYQAPVARVQAALSEGMAAVGDAGTAAVADSSVGARLYMWKRSAEEITTSPLWGHGKPERLALIKSWGEESGSEHVKSLGHVHNEYLQAPLDHGVWGLISRLLPLVALLAMAWVLRRGATVPAACAVVGVAAMAWLAGLTNVNTAHNYYGAMLSLSVGLAFLGACQAKSSG